MADLESRVNSKIADIIRHGGDSEFYKTPEARVEVKAEIVAEDIMKCECENSQKVKEAESHAGPIA